MNKNRNRGITKMASGNANPRLTKNNTGKTQAAKNNIHSLIIILLGSKYCIKIGNGDEKQIDLR
jgi:hypothetical protein